MHGFRDDIVYSLRRFARQPFSPILSVAALALAIGAGSVIFSAVYAVLLHPLPFADADRLVSLWASDIRHGNAHVELSYEEFQSWQRNSTALRASALVSSVNLDYTVTGSGEPLQVEGTLVTSGFFETLAVTPVAGRVFTAADDVPNAPAVAVMSDRLWKSRFGGSTSILGSSLRIDGQVCTIVGIMHPAFDYPRGVDLWTPLFLAGQDAGSFVKIRIFQGIGRLADGITIDRARSELAALQGRSGDFGIAMDPLGDSLLGNSRTALPLLLLAVVGVIGIACMNVAHLRLADTLSRQRELAVRTAMGATAGRTFRQLLTESALLSIAGGVLGVVLAVYGVDLLIAFAPHDIPRIETATVNGWVLAFVVLLVAASSILTGLFPALEARRLSGNELLQESGTRGSQGRSRSRMRNWLIAGEVAVGTTLLIGGGLLLDSARRLGSVEPGFSQDKILTFRVTLPRPKYQEQAKRKVFYDALLTKLRDMPGVASAGAVLLRPLSGAVGWDFPFSIEGQTEQQAAGNPPSNFEAISAGYFDTMRIPLLAGRDFKETDRTGAPPVAIIGDSLGRRYFPDGRVVGKRIKIGNPAGKSPWLEIVGVAKDVRYREWESTRLDFYVPVLQNAQHRSDFVVRAGQSDVLKLTPAIRQAVLDIDPSQPISSVTTVEGLVSDTLARPRFHAGLLTLFAVCALLLVVVGIFGVVSQSVSQRRQEIGIRLALGAQPSQLLRMVLEEGVLTIGLGVVAGSLVALVMGRTLAHLLFGITWWHPGIYAVAIGVVFAISVGACLVPAIRASRADPMIALAGFTRPSSPSTGESPRED